MRLAEAPDRSGRYVAGLALLATAIVTLQLRWTGSDELARLACGWRALRDAWEAALDPEAFRPARIDVAMRDAERARIDRHVLRSLELGAIPHGEDDWVEAKLGIGLESLDVKARLKGDLLDHVDDAISLRIALRSRDHALGLRTFNLQHPKTRRYLWEWAYMRHAESEDLLTPRHEFVDVSMLGTPRQPYLLLEHFSKELLERQRRRDGVIVKFSEADYFAGEIEKRARFGNDVALRTGWRKAPIEVFGERRIAKDPELSAQRDLALARFEAFRREELEAHEIFDVERTARWLALSQLWGAHHGLHPNNTRVYYDALRGRFEPIAFDGFAGPLVESEYAEFAEQLASYVDERFLADPLVSRHYVAAALRISSPAAVDALLERLAPELEERAEFLLQDPGFRERHGRWTHFGWLHRNARWLRERVAAPAQAIAEVSGASALRVRSRSEFALEWRAVELANGRSVPVGSDARTPAFSLIPGWRPRSGAPVAEFELPRELGRPTALVVCVAGNPDRSCARIAVTAGAAAGGDGAELEEPRGEPIRLAVRSGALERARPAPDPDLPVGFGIEARDALRWVVVPPGEHRLRGDLRLGRGYGLIGRPGARLLMDEGVAIVVEGPVRLEGSADAPIELAPLADHWAGLVVVGSDRPSELRHVRIRGVRPAAGTRGPRRAGWVQTGGVAFVDSGLRASHVAFEDFGTEDALNVVRAEVVLRHVRFARTDSDAFDGDFVDGSIEWIDLEEVAGDGVDVSGSTLALREVRARGVRDKAVSVGERSQVDLAGLSAREGAFALVAKDGSEVRAERLRAQDVWIALAAYTKKPEFGPARIQARGLSVAGRAFPYLVQTGSRATLDGRRLPARSFDSEAFYAPR